MNDKELQLRVLGYWTEQEYSYKKIAGLLNIPEKEVEKIVAKGFKPVNHKQSFVENYG